MAWLKRIVSAIFVLFGRQVYSETQQAAASATIASAASTATKVVGGMTLADSFFLSNQFFGLVGALCAVGSLLINWYFRRREMQLKEREIQRTNNVQNTVQANREQ